MTEEIRKRIDNLYDYLVNEQKVKPPFQIRFRKGLPDDLIREITEYVKKKQLNGTSHRNRKT